MRTSNYEGFSQYLLRNVHRVPTNLFAVARAVEEHKQKPVHILKRPLPLPIEGLVVEDPHGYNGYFIIVNSNHVRARQRTTIAHEVSEIFLGQLKTGTILNRLTQPNKKNENRAFALAKLLLVPGWFLRDAKEMYGDDPAKLVKFIADHCQTSLDIACLRVNNAYPEYGYTLRSGEKNKVLFSYGLNNNMNQESVINLGKYTLCAWR